MGGGLLQLVAYGALDVYLIGNPQITLFKSVYKRHTNFSKEIHELSFKEQADFDKKISVVVNRKGDLLSKCYIKLQIDETHTNYSLYDMLHNNGYAFIEYVELVIGGQVIDKQYGEWMSIWSELSLTYDKMKVLQRMIDPSLHSPIANKDTSVIYIPLQFFFCKNYGCALPLVSLQYQEVSINVKFNNIDKVLRHVDYNTSSCCSSLKITDCLLSCEYIYLDKDERKQFVNCEHEILIEQIQSDRDNSFTSDKTQVNINLDINHPVKEIVWVIQDMENNNYSNTFNFWNNGIQQNNRKYSKDTSSYIEKSNIYYKSTPLLPNNKDHLKSAVLQLNGQDRFEKRDAHYFRNVQRYQHHSGSSCIGIIEHNSNNSDNGEPYFLGLQNHSAIYMYSFALYPERYQPSGTCNFSRIDNKVLYLELEEHYKNPDKTVAATGGRSIHIYAISYNILKIKSGLAGLTYAN